MRCEPAPHRYPHLRMVEVPLHERTAPAHLAAEYAAQLCELQLIPMLAAHARQQNAEITFAPASTADRDQREEVRV